MEHRVDSEILIRHFREDEQEHEVARDDGRVAIVDEDLNSTSVGRREGVDSLDDIAKVSAR